MENDTNDATDVFVHDLQTGTTIRASVASDESQADAGSGIYDPSISSDGRYVVFDSSATNLVPNDTNGQRDIFIRDLQLGTTIRVSVAQNGSQANGSSGAASISPDGKFISFFSTADNLTPNDMNDALDIFIAQTGPTIPYLSQKDLQWGTEEYDHANTIGPFFCGSTIAGCGCAITSSAMLLKYYGVDKNPDGLATNPETLNNWLKENKGYAFGALKWPSIASYTLKANEVYGTQTIKFVGFGSQNDFTTLNSELENSRPTILAEPGHYIIAKSTQGTTYSINDPAWQNRTTLESYNNKFNGVRLFDKTSTDLSAIYISTPAPTDFLLTDSTGKRVGKDPTTGTIYNEIPNSFYTREPTLADQTQENPTIPDSASGINTLVILTPQSGAFTTQVFGANKSYSIDFSAYDKNGEISTQTLNQMPFSGAPQNYELKFSPDSGTHLEIVKKIEIDVRPESKLNLIYPKAGIIPVVIIGRPDFKINDIDINSVKLGPNEASPIKNISIKIDLKGDKNKDLLLFFKSNRLGLSDSDTQICLMGKTTQDVLFEGCDKIKVVRW